MDGIAPSSVSPHWLPLLDRACPSLDRHCSSEPVFRTSGWYCSTFGLSSLAPFATHLRASLRSAFQDRVLWRWAVSPCPRSFLTASICYTLLHLAFPRFAMVCYTLFAPMGSFALPSLSAHRLPLLYRIRLCSAMPCSTTLSRLCGGGGFRSRYALSHRLPLLFCYRH